MSVSFSGLADFFRHVFQDLAGGGGGDGDHGGDEAERNSHARGDRSVTAFRRPELPEVHGIYGVLVQNDGTGALHNGSIGRCPVFGDGEGDERTRAVWKRCHRFLNGGVLRRHFVRSKRRRDLLRFREWGAVLIQVHTAGGNGSRCRGRESEGEQACEDQFFHQRSPLNSKWKYYVSFIYSNEYGEFLQGGGDGFRRFNGFYGFNGVGAAHNTMEAP